MPKFRLFLSCFLVILALVVFFAPGCQSQNRRVEREDTMTTKPLSAPPMDGNIPDRIETATFALG